VLQVDPRDAEPPGLGGSRLAAAVQRQDLPDGPGWRRSLRRFRGADRGARREGRRDPGLGARRDAGLAGGADDLDQQVVRVHADAPALGAGDADVQPPDAPPRAGARHAHGGRHRHRGDRPARAAAALTRVSRPMPRALQRCFWAGDDPLMVAYHDEEWGVPIHDDRRWYEKLTLDGAQAGLSWMTILRKREGYRAAFRGFGAAAVAPFAAR